MMMSPRISSITTLLPTMQQHTLPLPPTIPLPDLPVTASDDTVDVEGEYDEIKQLYLEITEKPQAPVYI